MANGDYIYMVQGDTFTYATNVALNGVAQNVFGAELSFYALANPEMEGATAIINVNSTAGYINVSGAGNNTVTVTLNSAFTNNVTEANVGHWFLRGELSSGAVHTFERGRIAVRPGFAPLPL